MPLLRRAYWPVLLFVLTLPFSVHAGGVTPPPAGGVTPPPCDPLKLCNPIKFSTLTDFLLAVLNVVLQYSVLLIVLFLVYAGFQFVTAQGNTEKLSKAKQMFVWIIIGAFVILGVYVIRAAICGTLNSISQDPAHPICAQ